MNDQRWSCLQINHFDHPAEAADVMVRMGPPELIAEILRDRPHLYQLAWRFDLPANLSPEECLAQAFLAGNGETAATGVLATRDTPFARSVSAGDLVRQDQTGRLWICRALGWLEIQAAVPQTLLG